MSVSSTDPRLIEAMQLHRQQQFAAAEQLYEAVLHDQPRDASTWHYLGLAAYQRGDYPRSVECVQTALRIEPGNALICNTYGAALRASGQRHRARLALQQAVSINPSYDEGWCNLGGVCNDLLLFSTSEQAYRRALEIRPNYAAAALGLANALIRQGRFEETVLWLRRAIELDPCNPDAWNNLGNSMQQRHELLEAVACYERAIQLAPRHFLAYENLNVALSHLGQIQRAIDVLRGALPFAPQQQLPSNRLLLSLNYHPRLDARTIFEEHRQWGAQFEARLKPLPTLRVSRDPHRVLRIGYMSGDFREHALARFVEPFFRQHDRAQVSTIGYSDAPFPDAVTEQLRSYVGEWRATYGWDDQRFVQQVRSDNIDILVDLSGHTSLARLVPLAARTAPIQVTYLGYANTTGLSRVDYLLSDSVLDPPGSDALYTEQLVRLDPCFACYAPPSSAPTVAPSPVARGEPFTFGSLHGLAKMNADVFDVWAAVLRRVSDARLLLFRTTFRGPVIDYVTEQFRQRGIERQRLLFDHDLSERTHLDIYAQVDVALDVFPWSGHTTACDALWMGVPMLTWRGTRRCGRLVASALTALGRNEWIAETHEQYVELAAQLAERRSELPALRATLRDEMAQSGLCDAVGFTRRLEQAYRAMWLRWLETHPE